MKKSELTFLDGFLGESAKAAQEKGAIMMYFDWNKAAIKIKELFTQHEDLMAEAGLQGDWEYTGGVIFKDRHPTNEYYTYLGSNWATPILILSWDEKEQLELECFTYESSGYDTKSKWDEDSLAVLGIKLNN